VHLLNPIKIFLQKVHVEKFRCQFFLDFFCFIAVSGVSFGDGSSNTPPKKTFSKQIVSNSFYKKIDQKPKNRFFLDLSASRFSVTGVPKKMSQNKCPKTNLTLVLFWPLAHPTTTGVTDFILFGGPLGERPTGAVLGSLCSYKK
jgi:hypothetical protein